jgi:hypothetical protein
VRRSLLVALVLSLAVHGAFSRWPVDVPATQETAPLQATLLEMPPPPKPLAAPAPAAKPKPRPQRATAVPPPHPAAPETAAPEPEQATTSTSEPGTIDPTPEAIAAGPQLPTEVATAEVPAASPEPPPKALPPRVDLVYKAFLGTQGFLIGEATYRFEHAANEYRIATVGEAKGLAALFLRGQGKVESRGIITPSGLQPLEFSVERGSRERRETALFDWEIGIVTLHEEKTAALELPTFDPLMLMWQAYFTPPVDPVQTISVATTRRVGRYTITREAEETIPWGEGEIATERWHRQSEDGNTDGWVWLAPSLHYVPVKMRVTHTRRGTLEALLDSIRVDEKIAQQ